MPRLQLKEIVIRISLSVSVITDLNSKLLTIYIISNDIPVIERSNKLYYEVPYGGKMNQILINYFFRLFYLISYTAFS